MSEVKSYEIRIDTNYQKNNYYIRGSYPSCYITDNMSYKEIQKVAKSMRQLGMTVLDKR